MSDIHIAWTGIWYPEDKISNLELVESYNNYVKRFNIDKVSILKINIEGSEYSFLDSLDETDFSKINQIVISFHDWLDPNLEYLTKSSLYLLKQNGYTIISTFKHLGWYLCTKNIWQIHLNSLKTTF